MMNWDLYLNFLAAMIAIVNPLGLIPLWSQFTNDLDKMERRDLASMLITTAVIILLIFLLFGRYILAFFSIDIPVFQIAGGVLLLFTGLSMVNGNVFHLKHKNEEKGHSHGVVKVRFREILVPMAIPMLSGPGSLTTVILFGYQLRNTIDYIIISVILLIVLLILYLVFVYSEKIEKKTDPIFFNILTRLLGIIVVAISIQFMVDGFQEIYSTWNS